jgi:hypothetical protein
MISATASKQNSTVSTQNKMCDTTSIKKIGMASLVGLIVLMGLDCPSRMNLQNKVVSIPDNSSEVQLRILPLERAIFMRSSVEITTATKVFGFTGNGVHNRSSIPKKSSLRIFAQSSAGSMHEFVLPSAIKEQLVEVLRTWYDVPDQECCYDFISRIYKDKKPWHPSCSWGLGSVSSFPFRWEISFTTLNPGDAIWLSRNQKENHHFAMYLGIDPDLGEPLFISKYGNGGPLVISTLENLQQSYQCNQVLKITPRDHFS